MIDDNGLKTYFFKNSKAKIIEKKVGSEVLKTYSTGEGKIRTQENGLKTISFGVSKK
jgi:hypothetical protein